MMLEVELSAQGIPSKWLCLSTVCTVAAGLVQEHAADVDSIAVITAYKRQEKALRARFADEPGLKSISSVYFGTVDGFQVCASSLAFMHGSASLSYSPIPLTSDGNRRRADT